MMSVLLWVMIVRLQLLVVVIVVVYACYGGMSRCVQLLVIQITISIQLFRIGMGSGVLRDFMATRNAHVVAILGTCYGPWPP